MARELHVGTSGWVYDDWQGRFYPEDLPKSGWLPYYARHFDTVEINNTYYRFPREEAVAAWRDAVPRDFTFAVKAHRNITHRKRLKEPETTLRDVLPRMGHLGKRLGVLLFQLPPQMRFDADRLRAFLDVLATFDAPAPYAFEFRHDSWYNDETYDLLEAHGIALTIHDLHGEQTPIRTTAPLVYVRFHGPEKAYSGTYGKDRLEPWAERIARWRDEGRSVFCYFNNDWNAEAVGDARTLRAVTGDLAPHAR